MAISLGWRARCALLVAPLALSACATSDWGPAQPVANAVSSAELEPLEADCARPVTQRSMKQHRLDAGCSEAADTSGITRVATAPFRWTRNQFRRGSAVSTETPASASRDVNAAALDGGPAEPASVAIAAASSDARSGADARAETDMEPTVITPIGQTTMRYTVKSGDTLWGIAERHYGRGLAFQALAHANRDVVSDPDRIYPGQVLVVPARLT